ncbi:MAG: ABC transporter permease subunit [Armatimonadota bacterium]
MKSTIAIARSTFGEAMRRKILNVFLILALGSVIISLTFPFLNFRQQVDILKSFGLGMIQFWGIFIAIIMGISLIPTDIDQRTIYTILSKPVKRYEYIVGRFLGAGFTLAVNIFIMAIAFILVFALKTNTGDGSSIEALGNGKIVDFFKLWHWSSEIPSLFSGAGMVFMKLLLLSSVAIFFSVFVSVTVNFFLSSAVFIVGSLSSVTESMAKSENTATLLKPLYTVFHLIVPNFGNYDIQNPLIHPDVPQSDIGAYMVKAVLYGVAYTIILIVLGVLTFERKEV